MSLVVALLIFVATSTGASLLLAVIFGTLTVPAVWAGLAAGTTVAIYTFFRCRGLASGAQKPSRTDILLMIFFLIFCARHFFWFYFYRGSDILTLNYGYADMHFHFAAIGNILNHTKFWPENPILIGEPMNYHFGMDLFTALWAKIGVPLPSAFALVGILGGVLALFALYWWGGGFTIAGFLFSGGLAGYLVLRNGVFKDYLLEMDSAWKNLAVTFVAQRAWLFALPAGLILLWSWRRRLIEKGRGLPKYVEIILLGMMPLFHLHSFLFLSFVYFFWSVWRRKVFEALRVYSAVLALALPLLAGLTNHFHKASVIWFSSGWMIHDQNPIVFFLSNFGLFAPLFLWATFLVAKDKDRRSLMILLSAWVMFVICMFVIFATWEWDNVKLITWSYLIMLPIAGERVIRKMPRYPKTGLIILLFLSGFVTVISSMSKSQSGSPMMNREERDYVCHMLKGVPTEARIATGQEGYHPVLFCGHKIVAGYAGTLWALGIPDSAATQAKLQGLMRGDADWKQYAREVHADYLFWGKREDAVFRDSNRPWEADALKLAASQWGFLYDLTKPSGIQGPAETLNLRPDEGLRAEYFSNRDGTGDAVRRTVEPAVALKWGKDDERSASPFSVRYQGEIYLPESGMTTFLLASVNDSKLSVGNVLALDNSGTHPLRVRRMRKHFDEGWYPIDMFYQNDGGEGYLKLWWQLPSGKEEMIPVQYLRHNEKA